MYQYHDDKRKVKRLITYSFLKYTKRISSACIF